jgi:DNA processing protein
MEPDARTLELLHDLAARCADRRRRAEFSRVLRMSDAERTRALESLRVRWAADGESQPARQHGLGQLLPLSDPRFPPALGEVPDPPAFLFAAGDCSLLRRPCVAVVGSRRATPSSIAVARAIAGDLARADVVVVSGMARGIDGAAHEAALAAGGRTIAVLGSGLARPYPAVHRGLFGRIVADGLAVSEHPPLTEPHPQHFPQRNRIISGLSLAVVVVEAAERSGSLGTAQQALEQGREVMVVPGAVAGGRFAGSHRLLRDGAALVESAADVLGLLGIAPPPEPSQTEPLQAGSTAAHAADTPAARLLAVCSGDARPLDDLAREAGLGVEATRMLLTRLEIEGFVSHSAHGYILAR